MRLEHPSLRTFHTVVASALVFALPGLANQRAWAARPPQTVEQHMLWELAPGKGEFLLHGEKLEIDCPSNCVMHARYEFESLNQTDSVFQFRAPVDGAVAVELSDRRVVRPVLKRLKGAGEHNDFAHNPPDPDGKNDRSDYPFYLVQLPLHLPRGRISIDIRYSFTPGQHEEDYSETSDGTMYPDFTYVLSDSPREDWSKNKLPWELAPDFQWALTATFPRQEVSWITRLFGNERIPSCNFWTRTVVSAQAEKSRFILRQTYSADFPSAFECFPR